MMALQIALGVVTAMAVHALALCITTRLMVEVRVPWSRAAIVILIEYAAIALAAGLPALLKIGNLAVTISAGSLAYLLVGAACIGAWVRFENGTPVGVGNGILIQAIQIPIIIPVLIVGSFLYDLIGSS